MPRIIPKLDSTAPSGEKKFVDSLQNLPGSWIVIPNYRPVGSEREADFTIITDHGFILVVEVKGGEIYVEDGRWTSKDWGGTPHPLRKSPYDQVVQEAHSVLRVLNSSSGLCGIAGDVVFGHCVSFPETDICHGAKMSAEEQALTIMSGDLADIKTKLANIEAFWRTRFDKPQRQMSESEMQTIKDALLPARQFKRNLASIITNTNVAIQDATDEQCAVMRGLWRARELLVFGCAGSGKTWLAIKRAGELSDLNMPVLLLCFNAKLAAFISRELKDKTNVKILHFHGLCETIIRESHVQLPQKLGGAKDETYYSKVLPDKALECLEIYKSRYDAVIVDEAQDFKEDWWLLVRSLLKDNGRFYLFADNNQRIYQTEGQYPIPNENAYDLPVNCRNAKAIYSEIMKLYNIREGVLPRCAAMVDGKPKEFIQCKNKEEYLRALEKVFNRLINEEKVPLSKITVLTPRSLDNAACVWCGYPTVGRFKLAPSWKNPNNIECASIHSFKGLENDVVILTETEAFNLQGDGKELLYVAVSRPKSHLIVLGNEDPLL